MTMIALDQGRQHLESLGLKQAVEALDNTLAAAVNKQLPYPEMLAELLGVDVTARRECYLTTKTRMAHLPFQPSNDEHLLKELAKPGIRRRGHQHPHPGTARRGEVPPGHCPGSQGHREGSWGLLRSRLRPDGSLEEGRGRAKPGPQDAHLPGPEGAGDG